MTTRMSADAFTARALAARSAALPAVTFTQGDERLTINAAIPDPDGGPVDAYDPAIARAIFSVVFHREGWRVARFALATEAGPSPYSEHTEAWLIWIAPCPDCGPPTTEPFAW